MYMGEIINDYDAMCQNYQRETGSIVLSPDKAPEDNEILFTCTYFFLRKVIHQGSLSMPGEVFINALNFLKSCRYNYPKEIGLFYPPPSWDTPNLSHDDLGSLICFSTNFASDIEKYLSKHFYIYDNQKYQHQSLWDRIKWTFKQTYFRFPYLHVIARLGAGKRPNAFIEMLYRWQLNRTSKLPFNNTSTKCLYVQHSVYWYKMSEKTRNAYSEFCLRLDKMYGDLQGLYGAYFLSYHPFVRFTANLTFTEMKHRASQVTENIGRAR